MKLKRQPLIHNKKVSFPDNSKGIFTVLINLLLYLLAMYSGDYIVWTVSVAISLLLILSFFSVLLSYLSLSCAQYLTKDTVQKGDATELVLECKNKLPFIMTYAIVLYKTPTNYIERLIGVTAFTIMPKQSFMLKIKINTQVKGIYDVGFSEMRITDYFGFFMFKPAIHLKNARVSKEGLSLVVTPVVYSLKSMNFSKIHDSLEDNNALTGYNEMPVISDLRRYQYGDPLKRINWKATAKQRKVFINNFEKSFSTNVGLYIGCLKVKDRISQIITEDFACDCAASLISYFLNKNISVTLMCDGVDSVINLNAQEFYHKNLYLMMLAENNIVSSPGSIDELRAKIATNGKLDYLYMVIEEFSVSLIDFLKDIRETGTSVTILIINDNNPDIEKIAGEMLKSTDISYYLIPQGCHFADVIGR